MALYQYYCTKCGYKREGLLNNHAIGIGSYSWNCPRCITSDIDSYASDGGDLVSTGVDSRDGNTVGDDRKSSKNCKRKR